MAKRRRRAYGTGSVTYTRGKWWARLPGKRQKSLGTYDTEERAHRILDLYLAEQAQRGITSHQGDTLGEFLDRYIEKRELSGRVKDIHNERQRFRDHINPFGIAGLPVDGVTKVDVQDWVDELRNSGRSHPLTKHCLSILHRAFKSAIDAQLITHNPAHPMRDLEIKARENPEEEDDIKYLSREEVMKLLHAPNILSEKQWRIFAFAIYTGMRQGEIFGLRWSDVHLNDPDPSIVVRYSWSTPFTKNGKVQRIYICPSTVALLRRIPRTNSFLVFPNRQGQMHYKGKGGGYDADWVKVRNRLGLNPEVPFHGLRHTAATLRLSGGYFGPPMSLIEVRDLLRHSTISMTERYAKLIRGDLGAAMANQTGPLGFRDQLRLAR